MSRIERHQLRRALYLYFIGYFLSMVGTAATHAADGWLAFRVTRSEYFLGFTALLLQIPYIVFSLIAIRLLQRIRLKTCLIAVYLTFGVSSLLFGSYVAIESNPAPMLILLFSVSQGLCLALEVPARLSILPQIVPREELSRILSWTIFHWNLTRIIGPLVAGWIIVRFSESGCFLLDGITYFLVALLIWLMPIRDLASHGQPQSIRNAAAEIWGIPQFRLCSIAVSSASSIAGIYLTFIPSYISSIHETPELLGVLRALVGVGGICAALLIARSSNPSKLLLYLPYGVLLQGVMLLVGVVLIYTTPYQTAAHALIAFWVGAMWAVVGGGGNIVVQSTFSDYNRAAGSTLWSMAFFLTYAVAPIVAAGLFVHYGFNVAIGIVGVAGAGAGSFIILLKQRILPIPSHVQIEALPNPREETQGLNVPRLKEEKP